VNDTVARLSGGVAAHASLFSTTADVARFARAVLNLGELDGVRVFRPETVRLFTSVQSQPGLTSPDANNLPVRRGLGWDIDTPYRTPPHDYTLARGARFPIGGYGHTGWTGQMRWGSIPSPAPSWSSRAIATSIVPSHSLSPAAPG